MKPSALRIERMLEKIEAKLIPPERKWLRITIHEGEAEAVVKEKQEKALAEHVARHPEDVGRTVEDFRWILSEIVRPRFRVEREIVKWPREAGDPPLTADNQMTRKPNLKLKWKSLFGPRCKAGSYPAHEVNKRVD